MSYMHEYIQNHYTANRLEEELVNLIAVYNKVRDTYLFVFATAIQKRLPEIQLDQDDYYMIADILRPKKGLERLDFYLETPGGRGETAEEIARFLHQNFNYISFIISGEAKSAGTILALSGHDILMTDTGSLGPIDAQVVLGRSVVSASDYVEWVNEKRKEAEENKKLNPFDAIMVAQITPGELVGVQQAYRYAQDLVTKWLPKYKFKNWDVTESRRIPVTEEMKQKRASEIAGILCNHSEWRSHGRSIKIQDLHTIGLRITRIDDTPRLAELVYRIQTVCRLLFGTTTAYKIYATEDTKLFKHAAPFNQPGRNLLSLPTPEVVQLEINCPNCNAKHQLYMKFIDNQQVDKDFKAKGCIPYPNNDKLKCSCGFEIDLSGLRNQVEMELQKKIIPS